jgi:polyhydroxyalkanoate synthase subunit PhaC
MAVFNSPRNRNGAGRRAGFPSGYPSFDFFRGMGNLLRFQEEMIRESSQNMHRAGKIWEAWSSPPEVKVGLTPKDVVYRENKSSLYRYHPRLTPVRPVPVLIVYALINRLYILDLYPGRSFVEFLLDNGLQVYAVDWGVPRDEDRGIPLDYFIEGYLDRMVKKVIEISGSPVISLFGYCIGGTLAAIYAALHPERIRNLALLTTPIDFSKGGYLREAVDKKHFPVDRIVDTFGNIPPWFMESGFKLLNPMGDLIKTYNLYKHIPEEGFLKYFLSIEKWVNDNIPFPGEAYRKYIKDFYQENKLYRGLLNISGRHVDLKKITASHLSVAGRDDMIAPAASAVCIRDLISSKDNTAVALPGGHIGVIVGGRALKTTWPWIGDWLLERSG